MSEVRGQRSESEEPEDRWRRTEAGKHRAESREHRVKGRGMKKDRFARMMDDRCAGTIDE